jgi:hypothetical protein
MPKIRLQRSGVVARIRECVAAGVTQHMRMGLDPQARGLASALDIRLKPAAFNGAPRSETKTKGLRLLSR